MFWKIASQAELVFDKIASVSFIDQTQLFRGLLKYFLPTLNIVKKLNFSWVSKTQFVIAILFLYYNPFYPEETYTKVNSSPNTNQ